MIPEFSAIKDRLVADILDAAPKETFIERVYLIGSGTDTMKYRPGESDLDIVVLYSGMTPPWGALLHDINKQFPGSWLKLEILLESVDSTVPLSSYECAFEYRVMHGELLFDAGNTVTAMPLPRDEAKARTILAYARTARTWHRLAEHYKTTRYQQHMSAWKACCAACRALHAVITLADIEFSPKALRWNLRALHDAALGVDPSLNSIATTVAELPRDLAQMRMDEIDDMDMNRNLQDEGEEVPLPAAYATAIENSQAIIDACHKVLSGHGVVELSGSQPARSES